jgi:hypothetical protein
MKLAERTQQLPAERPLYRVFASEWNGAAKEMSGVATQIRKQGMQRNK